MRFYVERTSIYDTGIKPCEGVDVEVEPKTDRYDMVNDTARWTIKFETLEELAEFVRASAETFGHDGIVMYPRGEDDDLTIEIYDDWRE